MFNTSIIGVWVVGFATATYGSLVGPLDFQFLSWLNLNTVAVLTESTKILDSAPYYVDVSIDATLKLNDVAIQATTALTEMRDVAVNTTLALKEVAINATTTLNDVSINATPVLNEVAIQASPPLNEVVQKAVFKLVESKDIYIETLIEELELMKVTVIETNSILMEMTETSTNPSFLPPIGPFPPIELTFPDLY